MADDRNRGLINPELNDEPDEKDLGGDSTQPSKSGNSSAPGNASPSSSPANAPSAPTSSATSPGGQDINRGGAPRPGTDAGGVPQTTLPEEGRSTPSRHANDGPSARGANTPTSGKGAPSPGGSKPHDPVAAKSAEPGQLAGSPISPLREMNQPAPTKPSDGSDRGPQPDLPATAPGGDATGQGPSGNAPEPGALGPSTSQEDGSSPSSGTRSPEAQAQSPMQGGGSGEASTKKDAEQSDEKDGGQSRSLKGLMNSSASNQAGGMAGKAAEKMAERALIMNPAFWGAIILVFLGLFLALMVAIIIIGIAGGHSGGSTNSSSDNEELGAMSGSSQDLLQLANQGKVTMDPGDVQYLKNGGLNKNLVALLVSLSDKYSQITMSSMRAGRESSITSSGNVSDHTHGGAADIASVNGKSCNNGVPGVPVCAELAADIVKLAKKKAPQVIYTQFNAHTSRGLNCVNDAAGGVCADHRDHVHVGFRKIGA